MSICTQRRRGRPPPQRNQLLVVQYPRVGPHVRSAVVGVLLHSELSLWSRNTLGTKQEGRKKRRKKGKEKKKREKRKGEKKEKRKEKGKGAHRSLHTVCISNTPSKCYLYTQRVSYIYAQSKLGVSCLGQR